MGYTILASHKDMPHNVKVFQFKTNIKSKKPFHKKVANHNSQDRKRIPLVKTIMTKEQPNFAI